MLNKRQQTILNYIAKNGEAKNADLLNLIGDYSTMTLWRDLDRLESEGQIKRVWGGAVIASDTLKDRDREHNFNFRIKQNTAAKEEISRIAADLIRPRHAYYFDAGSTIYTMTKYLGDERYTIVTSAANAAVELAHRANCTVTLLGGQLDGVTLSCSGSQSLEMLSGINIEAAVMATSGYSPRSGFTCGSLNESQLKKHVINKSLVTVMLLDHDKIGKNLPYTFSNTGSVDIIITDSVTEELYLDAETHDCLLFYPDDKRTSAERLSLFEKRIKK